MKILLFIKGIMLATLFIFMKHFNSHGLHFYPGKKKLFPLLPTMCHVSECIQNQLTQFNWMLDVCFFSYGYDKIIHMVYFLTEINFKRCLMFVAGILLFIYAPSLCKKVVFHYTTGTAVGVLGSVLIILYLISRLVPKVM